MVGTRDELWKHMAKTEGSLPSPIDLTLEVTTPLALPGPGLRWQGGVNERPVTARLENNGKSLYMTAKWAGHTPAVAGGLLPDTYVLSQVHFHWGRNNDEGSEHKVKGVSFPLEMHVIMYRKSYKSPRSALTFNDGVVVLAYLAKLSDSSSSGLEWISRHIPAVCQAQSTASLPPLTFSELVPSFTDNYLTYWGAVSNEVCSHSVLWLVSLKPMTVSSMDLEVWRTLRDSSAEPMSRAFAPAHDCRGRTVFYVNPSQEGSSFLTHTDQFTTSFQNYKHGVEHCQAHENAIESCQNHDHVTQPRQCHERVSEPGQSQDHPIEPFPDHEHVVEPFKDHIQTIESRQSHAISLCQDHEQPIEPCQGYEHSLEMFNELAIESCQIHGHAVERCQDHGYAVEPCKYPEQGRKGLSTYKSIPPEGSNSSSRNHAVLMNGQSQQAGGIDTGENTHFLESLTRNTTFKDTDKSRLSTTTILQKVNPEVRPFSVQKPQNQHKENQDEKIANANIILQPGTIRKSNLRLNRKYFLPWVSSTPISKASQITSEPHETPCDGAMTAQVQSVRVPASRLDHTGDSASLYKQLSTNRNLTTTIPRPTAMTRPPSSSFKSRLPISRTHSFAVKSAK